MVLALASSGAALTVGDLGVATATASQDSTNSVKTISECRVIDESGHYDLTTDLENDSRCIEITASNVTLDGNGHTISAKTYSYESAVEVKADDVTVTNLTVEGFRYSVLAEDQRNISVTDFQAVNGSIRAYKGEAIQVANTTLDSSTVHFSHVDDATLSELDGTGARVLVDNSLNTTVRDSSLQHATFEESGDLTIANNTPDESGRFGITFRYMGGILSDKHGYVRVTGNSITGNTGGSGPDAGIYVESIQNLTVRENTITGNEVGIKIDHIHTRTGQPSTSTVAIHRNDLSNNTRYGVLNTERDDDYVVNATHNYWGAADGPSSNTTEPLEDPRTGTLANGDGTAVSQNPDKTCMATVRFDPWLDQNPNDDGTDEESN